MKSSTEKLQKFFEMTGNEADSLIFLKSFRAIDPEKFLLIYAETEIVLESFSNFFYDLKILYSLELFPIILTGEDSISYIELFFKNVFSDKKTSKKNKELRCDIIPFSTKNIKEKIKSTIKKKHIPFVVIDSDNNYLSIASLLAKNLLTSKFLILSSQGGLRYKKTNEKISIINIRSDYRALVNDELLEDSQIALIEKLKDFLENQITHSMNIAITSPMTLLKELFTVKGSGTFIKLGSEIKHIQSIKHIDKDKLSYLLESAFRKRINPEFLESKIDSIFLEVNYRGAALLKENEFGFLLSKFAVDEIARGEGIGRDVWNEMKRQHKTIFWRAKPENQINKWYARECQGMDKGKDWNVYWINLDIEKIPAVCKYLRNQEQDFIS